MLVFEQAVHKEEGARMATAQLDVDSSKFNLPVVKASAGPDGIVVSKLRNDGWVTLDPGFLTTAQCES